MKIFRISILVFSLKSPFSFAEKPILGVLNNTTDHREIILSEAERIGMHAYIFDTDSKIDQKNNNISNVKILRYGRVVRSDDSYPLPDVVYDFAFRANRTDESKKKLGAIHSILEDSGVCFLIPKSVENFCNDKIQYANLLNNNNISHPNTESYSKEKMMEYIAKYDSLYLKPNDGSKGKGIIKIKKRKTGKLDISYIIKDRKGGYENVSINKISLDRLSSVVEEAIKDTKCSKKRYLVQEGIEMISFKNKPFHIRSYTFRGEDGEWVKPSLFAKVGGHRGAGGYTEHYSRIVNFVSRKTGISEEKLISEILKISADIHYSLESEVGELIAELGHDIVINKFGVVYSIETNLKSGQPVYIRKSGIELENDLFSNPGIVVHLLNNQFRREKAIAQFALFKSMDQKTI